MLAALAEIVGALGSLVVPPRCWGCRGLAASGAPLCARCTEMLPWLEPRVPLPRRAPLAAAWAPLSYEGVARALVHALKFSGAPGVAPAMAGHVSDALPPRAFAPGSALVPVPAEAWRRRQRGFDHAAVLAQELSELTGLAVEQPLARCRAQRAGQRGLGRAERLAGHGIAVESLGAAPAACVLVDDVMTTGATAAACARVLRRNGANSVVFVSYCRVI